jgi:hypothetical protein
MSFLFFCHFNSSDSKKFQTEVNINLQSKVKQHFQADNRMNDLDHVNQTLRMQ